MTLVTYTVLSQTRMRNSARGNPRYEFVLQAPDCAGAITARTPVDAGFVYGLPGNLKAIRGQLVMSRGVLLLHGGEAA